MKYSVTNRPTNHGRQGSTGGNSTFKKLAVQCSADIFVVNQSLVSRINTCGKNHQLLVATNL